MKKPSNSLLPVSVVIPMRNASTTVLDTLKSITKQRYPIREILVVDNVSKDNSRDLVATFAKKSNVSIRILPQKKDLGVSSSFNWGVREAKSNFVVFLTSDCSLPSDNELGKLVKPLLLDSSIVATYSTSVLPQFVWNTYNFWEKYYAARMVENRTSMMVLKFDCIRKDIFLKVGGFDEKNFGGDSAIGGEDADLNMRLRKEGKIVRSKANSLHLHYMANDYTFGNLTHSRKMYARSIGRFLHKSPFNSPLASLVFLIRPALPILPFIPGFRLFGILLILLYAFLFTRKMFLAQLTRSDPRIILVPLLNIFFLYYELFWTLEAFFSFKKRS
jgi:glycosyltransferase involved in cell wall biosynthesis